MSYIKGLTQEHFKALVLECIEDPNGERKLETIGQKAELAAKNLQAEMGWKRGIPQKVIQDWLQGLAGTCELPYTHHDIYLWACEVTGRDLTDKEVEYLQDNYWSRAAQALLVLINQHAKGILS